MTVPRAVEDTLPARSPSAVVVVVPRLTVPRVRLDDAHIARDVAVAVDIVDVVIAHAIARAKLCGRDDVVAPRVTWSSSSRGRARACIGLGRCDVWMRARRCGTSGCGTSRDPRVRARGDIDRSRRIDTNRYFSEGMDG